MNAEAVRRDAASAEFFDAAARGELIIRRCGRCGEHLAPRPERCAQCGGTDLRWVRAAGTGTLQTWTVARHRSSPPAQTVIGIIELDEGPWLEARLLDVEPETLEVGLPCVVDFVTAAHSESVPVFRIR